MIRSLLLFAICCTGCVTAADNNTAIPAETGEAETEDANQAIASGVTGSDIWLGQLNRGAQWSVASLRNITTRQGYDNQPMFTANSSGVFYTSIRDGVQADVYLFEPAVGAGFRFTSTPQSEFSPMPLPGGKGISVVRVEADGKQGLWRYAAGQPLPLLVNVDDLGYYTWLDAETVAMFLVTEPPTLALASLSGGEIIRTGVEPGRTLAVVPGTGELSFIDKSDKNNWWISRYDRVTGQMSQIAPTIEQNEDFAWTPDGQLLMADGKKIFRWAEQWELVINLDGRIPGDISRMSVSPDGRQIAFVAAEGGS